MADREARRLSFGSVAADYDRFRPSPPLQALDWLIPPGAAAILDLAAGTGAVTRELVGRTARVVAVTGRVRVMDSKELGDAPADQVNREQAAQAEGERAS